MRSYDFRRSMPSLAWVEKRPKSRHLSTNIVRSALQKNNEFAAISINPRNDKHPKFFQPLQGTLVGSGNSPGLIGPMDTNTGKPRTNLRQRIEELAKERDLTIKNFKEKETERDKL